MFWKLLKKELLFLLYSPAFYVVYVLFLFVWQWIFFKDVFLIGVASLSSLFDIFPWVLLVFGSALTMNAFSLEKDSGTLELLLTKPIKDIHLVLSKIVAYFLAASSTLIFTLPVIYFISKHGSTDWGIYIAQLIGAGCLTLLFVTIGVFISLLFESALASLVVCLLSLATLLLIGADFITIGLPFNIGQMLEKLAVLPHYLSLTKGVISLFDISYFLLLIIVFTFLSTLGLKRIRNKNKVQFSIVQIVAFVLLLVGIISLNNDYSYPRWDISSAKAYSLSPSTKDIVGGLQQDVVITVYKSKNLPSSYSPVIRDVTHILSEYSVASHGRLKIQTKIIPDTSDSDITKEAEVNGVQKTQFNVVNQEKLQITSGYFGLSLKYGNQSRAIKFINTSGDFEYQLTTILSDLASNQKKTLGFLTGNGEKILDQDYLVLDRALKDQFETKPVAVSQNSSDFDVLVVAGPTTQLDTQTQKYVKDLLDKGKSIVFLIDQVIVQNNLTSKINPYSSADFLDSIGITVRKDLVFDTKANDKLGLQSSDKPFVINYPFWVRSTISADSPLFKTHVAYVSLPWVSSITYDPDKLSQMGFIAKPLLVTTASGGATEDMNIDPRRTFSPELLGTFSMGITLERNINNINQHLVVIGDSELFVDQYLARAPQNINFGLEIFSWAVGKKSLGDINAKTKPFGNMTFYNDEEPSQIKNTISVIVVLVPLLMGFIIFVKRKTS